MRANFFDFAVAFATVAVPSIFAAASLAGSPVDRIEDSVVALLEAEDYDEITVYNARDLTSDVLENRRGTTVVERCIGTITDADGKSGIILNASDEDYSYIGYGGIIGPLSEGEIVLSYIVYSPDSGEVDDVAERYDFVLDSDDEGWEAYV